MEIKRKTFQGVFNIIRFNWHFYVVSVVTLIIFMLIRKEFSSTIQNVIIIGTLMTSIAIIISLIVSFYVYDLSDLYQLKWLVNTNDNQILNINAGFDETSEIIQTKFPNADITICDFYDPNKHTEISIKRARSIYPPKQKTVPVKTNQLPFTNNAFDKSLAILSAHEIRNQNERVLFFRELNRITKPLGQIFVTEHLRDCNNFGAYTIGVFHFYSRKNWQRTFEQAELLIKQEIKTTPFITTFILEKNGNTH